MTEIKQPKISIGMIFKNEIRCLERCLKSLTPLREQVACELVMADTGSDDGSREIAEKYADILFDFPWVDDFAAARNAVMDRCSGIWYFSIDADEWLDDDVSELVRMFGGDREPPNVDVCAVIERNYSYRDDMEHYGTFMPWRIVRMSTGARYQGAIHETWSMEIDHICGLKKTLLHHDGYVALNAETAKAKSDRNMKLLRAKMDKNPEDLLGWIQMAESCNGAPEWLDYIRRAIELVRKRAEGWDKVGPTAYRYAFAAIQKQECPESEEWLREAEELFPNSFFIWIDGGFNAVSYFWEKERYDDCVRWGERSLQAYADYRADRGDVACQMYGSLQASSPLSEESVRIILARAYYETGQSERTAELMAEVKCEVLDELWTGNFLQALEMLHFRSEIDTAPLVIKFWDGISSPKPDRDWADKRKARVIRAGAEAFTKDYHAKEDTEDFQRRVYTLFLPLRGKCALGTAAAILEEYNPAELEKLFRLAERWNELPIAALAHAIRQRMAFPMPDSPLRIEEMDDLAARLVQEDAELAFSAAEEAYTGGWQSITWARGLALIAVKHGDWTAAGEEEKGLKLARLFVKIERVFLSRCYTAEMLNEENICTLPAMHRFGWYCSQAFDALDGGDAAGYARLLREGLTSCESMKPMVEFLLEHTPELQIPEPKPSGELLELAEKVRGMLSAYAPDDPAVVMIKSSPAYQKVARLIEGPELALVGGLKQ